MRQDTKQAIKRILTYFQDRPEVLALYLFGSAAADRTTPERLEGNLANLEKFCRAVLEFYDLNR